MKIEDFKLECFFEKYEFSAPYLLAQSDCEAMNIADLLAMEDGAKEEFMQLHLGYSESRGEEKLRKQIAAMYEGMEMEDILVFHGAQEAIFAYMNVMLGAGDHLITMFPSYQSFYAVARAIPSCEISFWQVRDDGEKWTVDFDELEKMIKPNTKVLALNSPHNPTGYTFTNEEIERIVKICQRHNLHLFADEVYKGLELDGKPRHHMADRYENCASLGVLSKAYGLAGLRVGWLACKDRDVLDRSVRMKHYLSICDAVPSEYLARIALKHGDELLAKNYAIVTNNIAIAKTFFKKYEHLFSPRPAMAGPVAFHKFTGDMPVDEFCHLAVEKKGALLLPQAVFEMKGGYFRIGYGRKSFADNLSVLAEFIEEEGLA